MVTIKQKLNGATIIETIVALVIIFVVISIALTVFVQVTTADISIKKLRAKALVRTEVLKMKKENKITTEDEQIDDYRIEKEFLFVGVPNAVGVKLSVYDLSDRLILTQKYIILTNNKNE